MSNVAQAVIEQQQKRAAQQESSFESVDLTKYFTIALEKNIQRGEKTIRILPDPINPDGSPFVELYFHVVEVGGKKRKLYDPDKNEGKPSPLTEVYKDLIKSNDPATKAIAKTYRPRLYYIVRVIERGKEHEGVKFWRFPHDVKGAGVFDTLTAIFQKFGDITNPETGRDLSITLTKVKGQNNKEYTDISAILPNDVTVLSPDPQLKAQWLADKSTWESVYKKYDHEYLLLVAEGHTPMWSDQDGGKWIARPEKDETASSSTDADMASAIPSGAIPSGAGQGTAPESAPSVESQVPVTEDAVQIAEDDLPF